MSVDPKLPNTKTVPRVIFYVAARAETGGGHLVRSINLATSLSGLGAQCSLFVDNDPKAFAAAQIAESVGVSVQPTSGLDDTLSAISRPEAAPSWLVLDSYDITADDEEHAWQHTRNSGAQLAVISDGPDRKRFADLLVDQTLGRNVENYAGMVSPDCRILLGPAHALLHEQFSDQRDESLGRRALIKTPQNVLISCGYSDPEDATGRVVDTLAPLVDPAGLHFNIALSSVAPHLEKIRTRIASIPNATLHVDVTDMWQLMAQADLAVGTGGISAYERCTMGLASVQICVADNQRPNHAALLACGAAADGGMLPEGDGGQMDHFQSQLRSALSALVENNPARLAMQHAAQMVCDGKGAARVAADMLDVRPAANESGDDA